MRKHYIIIMIVMTTLLASCSHQKSNDTAATVDTIPMMVMQIQKCNRLYTTEAQVHKIVTHDDQFKLKGSFLKNDYDIAVPGSQRKVAIPMDATIKAYIDFDGFDMKNINRQGDKIEIILPDPKVILTSTKIDHDKVKSFVTWVRHDYSDAELSQLEQEGRKGIIADIPKLDIIETARQSAAHTLVPMLTNMGFKAENIKISFRKKFTSSDIQNMVQSVSLENK